METIINALIPLTFIGFVVAERLWPARRFPQMPRWVLKGLAFFVIAGVINGVLPGLYMEWATKHQLLHLSGLGTLLGAVVGFAFSDLVLYGVHRAQHRLGWLWRWTHQMHHSAERVDAAGAFFFHPIDITINAGLSTLLPLFVLGLSLDASMLAGYFGFFVAVFQHANLRTPHWLGYLVQRPEAHSIHHERGVHHYNYANLALWDMLFGTYRNPRTWTGEAGFWNGASQQLAPLLFGRDVSSPKRASRPELAADPAE